MSILATALRINVDQKADTTTNWKSASSDSLKSWMLVVKYLDHVTSNNQEMLDYK